jgi:hypothetical protein
MPSELDGVDILTRYGVRWRYGTGIPTDLNRDQALRWAAIAVDWASNHSGGASDAPRATST